MWTPTALASEARKAGGDLWRVVEDQHTASTRRIVDTQAEQDALEEILEESKPHYRKGSEHLGYLLKTPFRYNPPNPHGSRFRRAHSKQGVFYGSEELRTAMAEMSYYRLRFFAASPKTPFPRNNELLTAFTARYATSYGIDITAPPLNRDRKLWTSRNDYTATQALADSASKAGIDSIRYESARDAQAGVNVALLTPGVFTVRMPITQQTWTMFISNAEVSCSLVSGRGRAVMVFQRGQFGI
ncbi:MAG: RES family NAD+ phosphorylase [Sulfuricaulis sp.]